MKIAVVTLLLCIGWWVLCLLVWEGALPRAVPMALWLCLVTLLVVCIARAST